MSTSYRRYEILLPLRLNDGQPTPDELIGKTVVELREQFGAASSETQRIEGHWTHEGRVYRDELVRIFVDVPDAPECRAFFVQWKQTLKERFKQLDIWMTTYPLDVL